MDNALNKMLSEAIQAIESGADLDAVVSRYPEHAEALAGHLAVWRRLEAAPRVDAVPSLVNRGREQLLTVLAGPASRPFMPAQTAFAKAGAVAVAVLVLGFSAAGASAALGGPDIASNTLEAVGVTRNHEDTTSSNDEDVAADEGDGDDSESGEAGAPVGPNENANPNAFEGCENRDDGRNNAGDNPGNGDTNADPRSFEGGNGDGGKCADAPGPNPDGNPDNNAGGNPDNNGGDNPDNNAGGNPDDNAGGNPDNSQGSPPGGP